MVRPGSPASLWGVAGKAGYALSCVAAAVVLAVSGFSYFVVHDVSSIGGSHAISSGPSIGAQNILSWVDLSRIIERCDFRCQSRNELTPPVSETYYCRQISPKCEVSDRGNL